MSNEIFVVKMRSAKLCFLSATVAFLVLFSMLMFSVSAAGNQEDAASSVSEAEGWMGKAYEAVLDAESADAELLEVEAANARVYGSWVFLAISVVGVSVVVVGSVLGYRFFKRYYYDRLAKMRPKVDFS